MDGFDDGAWLERNDYNFFESEVNFSDMGVVSFADELSFLPPAAPTGEQLEADREADEIARADPHFLDLVRVLERIADVSAGRDAGDEGEGAGSGVVTIPGEPEVLTGDLLCLGEGFFGQEREVAENPSLYSSVPEAGPVVSNKVHRCLLEAREFLNVLLESRKKIDAEFADFETKYLSSDPLLDELDRLSLGAAAGDKKKSPSPNQQRASSRKQSLTQAEADEVIRGLKRRRSTHAALALVRNIDDDDEAGAPQKRAKRETVKRTRAPLSKEAVARLKAWMFEHFAHPYPTKEESEKLLEETGISQMQLTNWFVNSRRRLWHPMKQLIDEEKKE
jgi:hypothetical protein